jgi:hypothetical protein
MKIKNNVSKVSDMEILFHTNAGFAVLIAFVNALNNGLIVITMLAMTMAFVTEIFVMMLRDYSEVNKEMAKYRAILKAKRNRKKLSNVS